MSAPDPAPAGGSRLREVTSFFTTLGIIGFGGPMAHIAMMERDAVERRGWLSRERFVDALAATNLVPGPNSTEMAIHLGQVRAGLAGAIASGVAFITPAVLLMLALSWAYARWQTVPAIEDVFYGIKPAVIALIFVTAYRLFRGSVSDWTLAAIFVASGALAYFLPGWEIAILLGAGLLGILLYGPTIRVPRRLTALPLLAAPAFAWQPGTLVDLFWLCLRTGSLLFGGGYVMIPLLEHDVVERFHWMTREQFLDGVALGQSTPGPIVVTATFIGYQAAGLPGALVATFAIFLPAFVFAILVGRFLVTFAESPALRAAARHGRATARAAASP
jgi:chromate transporter